MVQSDLSVSLLSDSLRGVKLDLIVSGSIGAMESPRLVRALRRLGAEVNPFLTRSATMFTTETALAWAADRPVVTEFSANASHIGLRDACVVTPASAHLIGEIAHGLLSSPASALVASYLGQKKPVLLLPNMHDSLIEAPAVCENLAKITDWVDLLPARLEEGKQKFPDPKELADRISHKLRAPQLNKNLVLTMGTTRGYIDDVRYISNYSSGALGTEIAHEAFRQGFHTLVVCGPCSIRPTQFSDLVSVETNPEMEAATLRWLRDADVGVFAASVLDFVPTQRKSGKVSSHDELKVDFQRTKKLLQDFNPRGGIKVGFKLEATLDQAKALALAEEYMHKYDLSFMIANALSEVSATDHRAYLMARGEHGVAVLDTVVGKRKLAQALVARLYSRET